MRISDTIVALGLLGLAVGLSPAVSFDGTRTPETAPVSVPLSSGGAARGSNALSNATPLAPVTNPSAGIEDNPHLPRSVPLRPPGAVNPFAAFRSGTQALREGRVDEALTELEFAAERGVPAAIWKLGRMYADGEGVKADKARAYTYFRDLTTMHGYDSPGTPNARFVSNAYVALGLYHLDGIAGTLSADAKIAREMFREAASYFADPEAQYHLGRLYLSGKGGAKDPIQAARWLRLSANNGDHRAQALLGTMLFKGDQVPRQPAVGLFWLTLAKDSAGSEEAWINESYSDALAQAGENERALAGKYLEDWLKRRR